MRFIDPIFEPYDPEGSSRVPLTKYQEFCIRRFRLDRNFDTRFDRDRFQALLWYVEGYSNHRRPLRAPFSAAQVKWMMEADAPYASARPLPRIVEAFWRRRVGDLNPFGDDAAFLKVAAWWSLDFAPSIYVEHVLVPDVFINPLKAAMPGSPRGMPISQALTIIMRKRPDIAWSIKTEADRLACYIRLLCEPNGVHYALFFPDGVMQALLALPQPAAASAAPLPIGPQDIELVSARAAEAQRYIARHKRLRSGEENVWAPALDQDWTKVLATPAPRAPGRPEPPLLDGVGSVLPVPVRVIGPTASQSGLGQATRMSIESLLATGVKPQALDFWLDNPAPRRQAFREPPIAPAPAPGAINLIHLNAESIPLAPAFLRPELFEGAYNIGYFFWELPRASRVHHLALELLDEIWVSSAFNVESYQSLTDRPVIKVGMAVESLPAAPAGRSAMRSRFGLSETAYLFMATFDSFSFIQRKNPSAVLRAFLMAFGETSADVQLVIKTHNLTAILGEAHVNRLVEEIHTLAAADPRIRIIDQTLPFADLLALKAAADCYVTLHRSEGWGFGAIEAMQLGLPVIATAFSGNLEFCTAETAYNVGFEPRFLDRDDYIFVQPGDYWAEPKLDEAAHFLRHLATNPEEGRAMGQAAKHYVETHFSRAAVGGRYLARLREISAAR